MFFAQVKINHTAPKIPINSSMTFNYVHSDSSLESYKWC